MVICVSTVAGALLLGFVLGCSPRAPSGATLMQTEQGDVPPEGFVPDSLTAARIAEAIWIPIYGEQRILAQRPYRATLRDSVWTVEGSMQPPYSFGGVAIAEVAKADGRILRVSHGR